MSSIQRRLSDYLQYEMYHVVGAYGVAQRKLEELERLLTRATNDPATEASDHDDTHTALLQLARRARKYNTELDRSLHAAGNDIRHPIPEELPLSRRSRFEMKSDAPNLQHLRDNPWKGPTDWRWIPTFYDVAIELLNAESHDDEEAGTLARNFVSRRDGLAWGDDDPTAARARRLARFRQRRKDADTYLSGISNSSERIATEPLKDVINRVATANLSQDSEGSLPYFVIRAQAEAHLAMHAVEAWQSMPLGRHADSVVSEREWLLRELERCIALDTFVYCAARCAPWIFAENADECSYVFESFEECWTNAVPTRCMWLASQVSLLALHRRAYARALKGDSVGAYNDYHKLHRQIRDTRRRIQSAPIQVDGAVAFLVGLDAQAHHHIGELYRSQHAHTPAVKHFRSAYHGLEILSQDDEMREVLTNSRWRVQLHVSQGKANYELGNHKMGVCWHLRGWRAFLHLVAADTGTTANVEEVSKAIEWLTEVRYEPELRKSELQDYLRPVINQLDAIVVPDRLGALAADILLRLGHVLFVLNVGRGPEAPSIKRKPDAKPSKADFEAAKEQVASTLAFGCLVKAAKCDRRNTLVAADMLKSRLRFRSWFKAGRDPAKGSLPDEYDKALTPVELDGIEHHWPDGSDDYENLTRVAEYLILRAQLYGPAISPYDDNDKSADAVEGSEIARDLLTLFFMHTDSINVRKSQVHTFLMRGRKGSSSKCNYEQEGSERPLPTIEFVSMRRYSSAFPLLPRPSTFRALGGGYFIRLHNGESTTTPFGIVVDPGVDFIENLYRTGFSLSDIDMMIITHDHVDHLGSFDSLLSLLHEHSHYRKKQTDSSDREPRLTVYASRSVRKRYKHVANAKRGVKFRSLEKLCMEPREAKLDPEYEPKWPAEFKLGAMSSKRFNPADEEPGHPDLSRVPALGFWIASDKGPSIAITSDTPSPPDPDADRDRYDCWHEAWKPALSADVLICHLSTVPLTQLRQISQIDATRQPLRDTDREWLKDEARRLADHASEVLVSTDSELEPFRENLTIIHSNANTVAEIAELRDTPLGDIDSLFTIIGQAVSDIKDILDGNDPYKSTPDLPRDIYDIVDYAKDLKKGVDGFPHDAARLTRARRELQAAQPGLKHQIEFGLWLGSHEESYTADLLGLVSKKWNPPPEHAYLTGAIRWAREYKHQREGMDRQDGLLIIGELSEELGTVRSKIAAGLNNVIFKTDRDAKRALSALSSDIGLCARVANYKSDATDEAKPVPRILCTICDLDNDRVPSECLHEAHRIHEVCVKGENEGIFYNCPEHNPATQKDPAFLEQLERFDVFGR